MPDLSRVTLPLMVATLVASPVAVMWSVQKRAAATVQAAKGPAVPEVSAEAEAAHLRFNGFPYIRVSGDDVSSKRAVATFSRIVAEQTAQNGGDHPDTMINRNNLANALLAEGRYEEAEAAQRSLLADMERCLAPGHPDAFRCRFNLALNLRMQGKLSDARVEMEKVYAGWRQVLGEGHPRTQEALLVLENLRPES